MLESIQLMLKAFEKNNISYCHWKSNEHLSEALNGDTDLDVLFLPEQRALLEQILSECGVKRFRATPLMQYNAIEDYIGYDKGQAKIWHLHTHYKMTFGEKHLKGYTVTPWGYRIINNRIWDDRGIYTSSPEDELVMLMCRMAMKLRWRDIGCRIGKDDRIELDWLFERIDEKKFAYSLNEMLEEDATKEILRLHNKKITRKSEFNMLHRILVRELKCYTGNSRLTSWIVRSQRELFWLVGGVGRRLGLNPNKPSRRVSPSGGCVVAFLGCDGAGKSTTLKYVRNEFAKKIDVKTEYLGSGDGSCSIIRKPMKFIAKKVGGKGVGHTVAREYEKKKVSIKARLYSVAKIIWAYTLAKEKQKKLKNITKARNNGMLVLVDRYPQTEISGYSDGPLLTKYLEKKRGVLYRIAKKEEEIYRSAYYNKPDLAIKLMVPTEIAIKRKPEMTETEINDKKIAVMKMNCAEKIVVVDTSVEISESLGIVMNEIWKII